MVQTVGLTPSMKQWIMSSLSIGRSVSQSVSEIFLTVARVDVVQESVSESVRWKSEFNLVVPKYAVQDRHSLTHSRVRNIESQNLYSPPSWRKRGRTSLIT